MTLLWHWHELKNDLFRNDLHAKNNVLYGINCKMDLSLLWQWHDLEYDLFGNDLHFKLSVGLVTLYILPIYSPKIIFDREVPLNYVPRDLYFNGVLLSIMFPRGYNSMALCYPFRSWGL